MSRMLALATPDVIRRSSNRQLEVDAELALALLSKQPQAAIVVRQRFSSLVNGILRRALGRDADVEDAEQEVFLAIFRDIRQLRQPEALRSFVLTITKRWMGSAPQPGMSTLRARLRLRTRAADETPSRQRSVRVKIQQFGPRFAEKSPW